MNWSYILKHWGYIIASAICGILVKMKRKQVEHIVV